MVSLDSTPLSRFRDLLDRFEPFVYALLALLFLGFLLVQEKYLLDADLYFHIKIAVLLNEHGWVTRLPWMAHSIHAERYVDYHFLYHYLLVPFLWVTPHAIAAAKLATVTMGGFTAGMLVFVMKRLDVSHRWFWFLFFVLSSPIFTGRFLFGRASVLFIGMLFLYIYLLSQGRRGWLFGLSFLAVWTYPGFLLFPVFAFVYFLARGVAEESRWEFRPLFVTLGGILTGLVIHPSFPFQFNGYWLELVVHSLKPAGLEGIAEWSPPSREILLVGSFLPMLLFGIGLLMHRKGDPLVRSLFLFVIMILFSMISATKPFEYLVPVSALLLSLLDWERLPSKVRVGGMALFLVLLVFWSLPQTYRRINQQFHLVNPEQGMDAARWLEANTPEGETVMLPWSSFPVFFFVNHSNHYLFGLNPVYSFGSDPRRYGATRAFFSGQAINFYEIPAHLGLTYGVLSKKENSYILSLLEREKGKAEKLYENREYAIYRFPPLAPGSGRVPAPPFRP